MAVVDEYGALLPGQIVGVYEIRRKLGQGGFGITYLAAQGGGDRLFAIKEHFPREFAIREGATVRPNSNSQSTFKWARERFLDEARMLSTFHHLAINEVRDVIETNGTAYMVLQFEDAPRLGDWLDALKRQPSQAELDRIVEPLAEALEHVHGRNVLHRDIAPDNILIRRDGTPCLIDFGAARHVMGQQTKTLTALIKPGYSPIEQYDTDDSSKQGPWSDIYAFAATLYRAITGQRPPESTGRTLNDRCARFGQPDGIQLRDSTFVKVVGQQEYRHDFLKAIDAGLAIWPDARPRSVHEWGKLLLVPRPEVIPEPATVVVPRVEPLPPPTLPPPLPPPIPPPSADTKKRLVNLALKVGHEPSPQLIKTLTEDPVETPPDTQVKGTVAGPDAQSPSLSLRRRRRLLRGAGLTIAILTVLFSIYYATGPWILDIRGTGMLPNFSEGQYILRRPLWSEPKLGDVILYRDTRTGGVNISRILGLSGDRLQLRAGQVARNGEILSRSKVADHQLTPTKTVPLYVQTLPVGRRFRFIQESDSGFYADTPVVVVPPNHYFVLNDYRDQAVDSRLPSVGFIPRANVIGTVADTPP